MKSYHPRPVAVAAVAHDDAVRRFFIFALVAVLAVMGGLVGRAANVTDKSGVSGSGETKVSTEDQADPVEVTAMDLVEKVYGVADPTLGREGCRMEAANYFNDTPVESEGAEWMSGDEGFIISYQGQCPMAEAMVRYARNEVEGYGYIFYFPYESYQREAANNEQCRFCSALLGELRELGAEMGADPLAEALFDVSGMVRGRIVQLTLSEDVESTPANADLQAGAIDPARSGEFILAISIVPVAKTENVAQLENKYQLENK